MKHVRPGDELNLPASFINGLADMLRWWRSQAHGRRNGTVTPRGPSNGQVVGASPALDDSENPLPNQWLYEIAHLDDTGEVIAGVTMKDVPNIMEKSNTSTHINGGYPVQLAGATGTPGPIATGTRVMVFYVRGRPYLNQPIGFASAECD